MRFYRVTLDTGDEFISKWFSSRREGVKWSVQEYLECKQWFEQTEQEESDYPQKLRKSVHILPYDISTDKQGLLQFLNAHWPEDY